MGYKVTQDTYFKPYEAPLKPLLFNTIGELLSEAEKHIEMGRKCPKCSGRGFMFHSEEKQNYLRSRIESVKSGAPRGGGADFSGLAERLITTAFSREYECGCRKELDVYVRRRRFLENALQSGCLSDYVYDGEAPVFRSREEFLSHMVVASCIEKRAYKGYRGAAVYASIYFLYARELDYFLLRSLEKDAYDFVYIHNNGSAHKDYPYFKGRLSAVSRVWEFSDAGMEKKYQKTIDY